MAQQFSRGVPLDGSRLRQLRRALAYTQEQLATKAECDAKTVRKAERSEPLDLATIERLALALGVGQAHLIAVESDEDKIQVARDYIALPIWRSTDATPTPSRPSSTMMARST